MTTVEFGGGPTLAARQQFANLKPDAEIPNYAGHVHQLRFGQGHRYTEETHRVAKEYPKQLKRSKSLKVKSTYDHGDSSSVHDFPNGMIPGYSGYVPQRKFQHGHRFIVETDTAMMLAKNSFEQTRQQAKELQQTIGTYQKSPRSSSAAVVKHFLDYHRALHPNEASKQDDRRSFTEAPIPGYQGYIPRLGPIEVGVGTRFHEATKKALDRFAFETSLSTTNFSPAVDHHPSLSNFNQSSNLTANVQDLARQRPITISSSQTIYQRSGMVPRYAGHVPQRRYCVGQTFGDTTRNLPICTHGVPTQNMMGRSQTFTQANVY